VNQWWVERLDSFSINPSIPLSLNNTIQFKRVLSVILKSCTTWSRGMPIKRALNATMRLCDRLLGAHLVATSNSSIEQLSGFGMINSRDMTHWTTVRVKCLGFFASIQKIFLATVIVDIYPGFVSGEKRWTGLSQKIRIESRQWVANARRAKFRSRINVSVDIFLF